MNSNHDVNAAITTINKHPFVALLWIGEPNQNGNFIDATITVI